jgi:hypothetical protein
LEGKNESRGSAAQSHIIKKRVISPASSLGDNVQRERGIAAVQRARSVAAHGVLGAAAHVLRAFAFVGHHEHKSVRVSHLLNNT